MTKEQISSILNALALVDPQYLNIPKDLYDLPKGPSNDIPQDLYGLPEGPSNDIPEDSYGLPDGPSNDIPQDSYGLLSDNLTVETMEKDDLLQKQLDMELNGKFIRC